MGRDETIRVYRFVVRKSAGAAFGRVIRMLDRPGERVTRIDAGPDVQVQWRPPSEIVVDWDEQSPDPMRITVRTVR